MKKNSLTNLILLALERGVEAGELVLETSQELKEWIYEVYGDYPRPIKERSLSQAIRRLRLKGLIEQERRDTESLVLRLTQEGRELALLAKEDKVADWDGKWRIVVFDIPEKKRLVRQVWRRKLKNWGFARWQKSVWATRKNITQELRSLIKKLDIGDWVLVIESDNVG